jgi:hypothetical protein
MIRSVGLIDWLNGIPSMRDGIHRDMTTPGDGGRVAQRPPLDFY